VGATLVALFVFRAIPITADDDFYLEYFSDYREFGEVLLLAILDEPVFKLYTNFFYSVMSPEASLRVLILLTVLPHVAFAYRLGGWRAWTYMGGYFLFVELAPHLSWVQLRQGFALGVLLLVLHFSRERLRVLSVAIVGLIHTALLVLLPCFAAPALRDRRLAYALVIAIGLSLLAMPDLVGQLSFLLGRREGAYLDEPPTYSVAYVLYALAVMALVTHGARDARNADQMLIYHAMCALVLPMFFMTTFGAFAERLFFVVRWYELTIVAQSISPRARRTAALYIGVNVAYSAYHSIANFGAGGFLDRYLELLAA
jgi:hypothetical protein